jgi:Mg-chelatase subunit ChlD
MRKQSQAEQRQAEQRWRLILGIRKEKDSSGPGKSQNQEDPTDAWTRREEMLAYLYDREYAGNRNTKGSGGKSAERSANLGDSQFNVPDWINSIQELFPQKACEKMERDALERYEITEFLQDPTILAKAKPSQTLLKSILRTKNLMNQEVLAIAKEMVRKVVREMMERMAEEVRQPFSGVRDRNKRSLVKVAQNFDAKETIRRNLKHFDHANNKLVIEKPYFFSRKTQRINQWQIIIVVDQSGSMVNSVIHSAVTASVFHSLPFIKTNLIVFDTNIVDLTSETIDPVETLMKVQLGGGTDICRAMNYALQLIETPDRTIVILISDFFEGGSEAGLLTICHKMISSRVKLLGLAALDYDCKPSYNRSLAARIVRLGGEVGAMTPGELSNWVAQKMGLK